MFEREDCPTIMDGMVVRYAMRGRHWDGEINSSRNGVSISGRWPIMSRDGQIEEIIDTLKKAQVHHIEIRDWKPYGENVTLDEDQVATAAGVSVIAPLAE